MYIEKDFSSHSVHGLFRFHLPFLCMLSFYLFMADLKKWKNNIRERISSQCDEEGSPKICSGGPSSGHISQGP